MAGYCGVEIVKRIPEDRPCKVAEIGVWRGWTSSYILSQRPRATLYMVDTWAEHGEDEIDYAGTNTNQSEFNRAERRAIEIASR